MKIIMGKEPTQKEPEVNDALEGDIRALYKTERGKSAVYKRNNVWKETKEYLKFKDNYLSKMERDIQEEEEFAVDVNTQILDTAGFYITKGICMGCGQTKMLDAGSAQCIDCDNKDMPSNIKHLDKNISFDSKGIATIICKETETSKEELKALVKEQRELFSYTVREALLYLAIKLGVDLMDNKHTDTPKQMSAKMEKYREEHPEEWEAELARIKKMEQKAAVIKPKKTKKDVETEQIINEVKTLISADGLKTIIAKVNEMTKQDTALTIALLCGSLEFMFNLMNNKMIFMTTPCPYCERPYKKKWKEPTDEEKEIVIFIMEMLNK